MLRAKQIGNLSNSARSFLVGGSRCSAGDGSSCTCTEDETCISRRQPFRADVAPRRTPAVVGAAKVVDSCNKERAAQPISSSISVVRPDSVAYASSIDAVQQHAHSSPAMSYQLVKAGITAVSLVSDLMNFKIPASDQGGLATLPANYVVETSSGPVSNVKSANAKPVRRENFSRACLKPPSDIASGKSSTVSYHGVKDGGNKSNFARGGNKSNFVRGFKRVSDASFGSSERHAMSTDTCDKRRSVPRLGKPHSQGAIGNITHSMQKLDAKGVDFGAENYVRPTRNMNLPTSVSGTARPFVNSGHVVEGVTRILERLKWGSAAAQALENLKFKIDAYQANQVLKQLKDHSVALSFFNWLKCQSGFKHDGHTYTTMVGILGRAKQFGAIEMLVDEMLREGCKPNVVTYNRLIHSYGRANYLSEAMKIFNQMQQAGCEPDRVTYCTLIDIHAKAGYLDIAMDMYQRMKSAALSPDTFTYSVMINCLGKAGHLPAAQRLFSEMVDQGCAPNLVTYNIMIALHAKARNYQSALQLYRDMQNAGFEPDKVTYSIVMEVLGHCGYLDEAEGIFCEMSRRNWVPDEPVYGLLVDLWGKAGNVEKAWDWYQSMLHAGLRPNVPTCNSLLSAFLRMHRLSDAYSLLQSMLQLGLQPSLQTYTLLLSCCTEARSSYDMGFCCQLMAVTGHPAHMFLLSLPSAGPDGQNVRDHVGNFLDMMHSEDRESKRGLVDSVVDFLHKSGLKEEAGSVWEVAALKNVYPDAVKEKSSCYWMINLHVMSDGTAVTALSRTLAWLRRQMLVSGISPSRIDIVTGWGRRSRVTGTSLVRQAVHELLNIFGFPFVTENGNSGCFVGYGEPLNRWLVQSHVERMHLL